MDDIREITIAGRFHGPPRCGNGGYTAGRLAVVHRAGAGGGAGAVSVTLRLPPPLDSAMTVSRGDAVTTMHAGDRLVAEASDSELTTDPVESVSLADARDAETTYAGLTAHPFPTCFVCGPEREPGGALRLQPGRLGDGRTACTWTPDGALAAPEAPGRLAPEYVWAALDCPGGWTVDLVGRPMVLGRITAEIDAPAEIGERHVVMGRLLRHDGRKTYTTTTLYDSDGRVVARAEQVWFVVDPAAFS